MCVWCVCMVCVGMCLGYVCMMCVREHVVCVWCVWYVCVRSVYGDNGLKCARCDVFWVFFFADFPLQLFPFLGGSFFTLSRSLDSVLKKKLTVERLGCVGFLPNPKP